MNVTSTEQAKGVASVVQPILHMNSQFRSTNDVALSFVGAAQPCSRHVGYGLPCSNCGTYYLADESVCPICKCGERISPTTMPARLGLNTQSLPDTDELEEELEPEFKSQFLTARMQINTAAMFRCNQGENHQGGHEPAICRFCYDHLQRRADLMEAALHIDLKEAAQLVYEAVWSDPSDPSKTYQNAAQALLTELRKRSGIVSV